MLRVTLMFSAFLLIYSSYSQSSSITIDGCFDDWTTQSTFVDSPESISGIDLLNFQVTNDENYLFVKVEMDTELDLTDEIVPQTLICYIDADNDASTGFSPQSGFGSELGIRFNEHFAYYDVVPSSQPNFYEIELVAAPTVSSNVFEFSIPRSVIPDGINPLFPSDQIKILFRESDSGDNMPNNGSTFVYTFDETPASNYPVISLEKEDPNYIRFIAYNTLANGLTNAGRQDEFEDIIIATQPDIIAYSEVAGISASAVKSLMDNWIPLGTTEGWYTEKDDFDLITASKWPITQSWSDIDRQFPTLIDLPEEYGSDLMIINSHLSCCANDAGRQNQVDQIISFILDAKTAGGNVDLDENTPILYGGDLNLVGYAQQLNTLLDGDIQNTGTYGTGGFPDWDNSSFTELKPYQTGTPFHYTWWDDGSSYPPGKLDFIIYSDAVIDLEKAQVLNSAVLSPLELSNAGLTSNSTANASDHLPVIADFNLMGEIVDEDEDGVDDSIDNCLGLANPLQEDFNDDGIGDSCQDSDNDGLSDEDEITIYMTSPILQDSDGDGLTDLAEVFVSLTDPNDEDTNDNDCNDLDEFGGLCFTFCDSDINEDGQVDIQDLLLMLSDFGQGCE